MIYLTTGANGAGKTLNVLKFVREKQLKELRPVYYSGVEMKPEIADQFGWKKCDLKHWQDLPDGSIVIADECQKDFPARAASAAVPPHVQNLDEHRKRGFDFFMITQHPQNIDQFVRRLIGSPGWHRHIKRAFGANMVSVLEWNAVETSCEKPGAGKTAQVSMVPFPKEVYGWYNSAVLHTAKATIPRAVYVLGASVLLIPLLFFLAYRSFSATVKAPAAAASAPAGQFVPVSNFGGAGMGFKPGDRRMSDREYLESTVPRVQGLPHTAARYDELTQPTTAPYPAACVKSKSRCTCFTQQATPLSVPAALCAEIVAHGYFVDFDTGGKQAGGRQSHDSSASSASFNRSAVGNPGQVAFNAPQRDLGLSLTSAQNADAALVKAYR